jgi:RNA polymerase sigma-70 factor (ECF subfamily)
MRMTLALTQVSLSALSDAELASHIGLGDARALELMMRRHNRLLYRTARSILRDDAEAEDCVQEAYLQAFRSIARFRAESKLSTWLTRIVINQALGKLRRSKREDANVSLDNVLDIDGHLPRAEATLSESEQPDAAASREEVRRLLERHIDRLPAAFRTVFVLRALEELSVEETAASLGIPSATVRTRFFRARSLLREALESEVDVALEGAFGFEGARCDRIVAAVLERLRHPPAAGPGG